MGLGLFLATLLLTISVSAQVPVTVTVDVAADRHPIDSRIYGVAFATAAQLSDLSVPTNRSGGNATTRYNWQDNASNRASDWFFESIGEKTGIAGGSADSFIADAKSAHSEAMITIPTIGWVAKLGPNRTNLASFSVAKYGIQQSTDFYMPDAGNGVRSDGSLVTGNNPNDANIPADAQFQAAWVRHMVSTWGEASSGGVRYYLLDNEPSIWFATHRDVHPEGARMDEVLEDMIAYAEAIKAVDASALVLGPEEWGWSGYFYSGYDQQWGAANNWSSFPDRESHGGRDYIPYLLQQLKAHQDAGDVRLLDVLTVHYYPQGGEFSDDVSEAMQLRRNRSTRALWDVNYKDESWIDDKVALIPRLRTWVNAFYPGTMTGITEYNWGAEKHINGATAQADILGIFGREAIDMANRWTTPDSGTPAYNAIRMYRNYDGRKSAFGDVSVRATAPDPDTLSAFAATRTSDGALTVMLVCKALSGDRVVTINVQNRALTAPAQVWQLTSSNAIRRLSDASPASSNTVITVPPQSITLLLFPTADGSRRRAVNH
ncbi:MAG TPA: glycoside hydrolase family 44 protein [Vicinamibacterales bacterium]